MVVGLEMMQVWCHMQWIWDPWTPRRSGGTASSQVGAILGSLTTTQVTCNQSTEVNRSNDESKDFVVFSVLLFSICYF
jgi:hypothetical protein